MMIKYIKETFIQVLLENKKVYLVVYLEEKNSSTISLPEFVQYILSLYESYVQRI